jgi:hypothetical protein
VRASPLSTSEPGRRRGRCHYFADRSHSGSHCRTHGSKDSYRHFLEFYRGPRATISSADAGSPEHAVKTLTCRTGAVDATLHPITPLVPHRFQRQEVVQIAAHARLPGSALRRIGRIGIPADLDCEEVVVQGSGQAPAAAQEVIRSSLAQLRLIIQPGAQLGAVRPWLEQAAV